jgi:uncharacterized 2Fe-2S/4Fe-4S cluster protein (DUF4445 family)
MSKVKVEPSGQSYAYEPEKAQTLLEILLENQVFIDNPCNGKGVCGKCRVKVLSDNLSAPHPTEEKLLKPEELEAGIRLACLIVPEQDLEIELLQKEQKHTVLTSGYVPEFDMDCAIRKQVVEIQKPTLEDQTPVEDQIKAKTGIENIEFSALLADTLQPGLVTVVSYGDKIIQVEAGDTTGRMYGVAIDIGTTTVVCSLVDLQSGDELANASMINAQKHLGQDVLTRISYELEHPEDGIEKLQTAIVDSINDMIAEICQKAKIQKTEIYEITVGANCTMMHMLLGVSALSIGKSPYAPIFVKAKDVKASDIGIQAAKGARLYCLPSVSAYIGADIVAGTYVCELQKEQGNVLFIDIGTNGEIVLSYKGELLCCSCAAGPALEGMNITAGMRAAEGAIEDVRITPQGIELDVIGDKKPIGVCGSGILAIVRELLKSELLQIKGTFIKKETLDDSDYRYDMIRLNGKKREFLLTQGDEPLCVTQSDIRQVQLAKGAILSGFIALLKQAGLQMEDLDKVMIAGQFGAHLPVDSLIGTGILPEGVRDKLVYVGNSSKTGAYMALLSEQVKRDMEKLADDMKYVELGASEGYERLFSECLMFPDIKLVRS